MKTWIPAVLREERQFALLFAGQSLSVLGDRVSFVAVPFAVLSIGGSSADVGTVTAAGLIPFLLFALVGGVWADRLPRHRVMLVSDLVRLVTQGAAATLLLVGAAEVWHLAALMAVFGTADAFFMPALTGLTPLVVAEDRLREANALRGFVMSVSLVSGPAVGGGLIAAFGPGGALALDAATFAVSAACLARLSPRATLRDGPDGDGADGDGSAGQGGFLGELRAGWTEVRTRSWVWSTMLAIAVYEVVVLPSVYVLGPVLTEREFGGASDWAVVVAAFGVGSIAGDLLVLRVRPPRPLAVASAALAVSSCQALIIGGAGSIAAIAALEAVTGVAVSVFFTLWETALQTHIPERSLSRVSSYDYLVSMGMAPLGLVLAGPISEAAGMRPTLYGMTAVGVPVSLALLCLPSVRRLPPGRAKRGAERTGGGSAVPAPAAVPATEPRASGE